MMNDKSDISNQPQYQQQWERVNRWYARFKNISEKKNISETSINDDDEVLAFFQNCYHLKDWIKNDPSAIEIRDKVESFINKSEPLSICADLCNGSKHLVLSKSSRSGQNPKFGENTQRVFLNNNPTTICRGYSITTDQKTFDAFDLAFLCMQAWQRFIYLKGDSNY